MDLSRPPQHIPESLEITAGIFKKAGYQCWLVGGAVRDGLLGKDSVDYDLATDAEPEEVIKLFNRTVPTGIKHGTVTILLGGHQFETTTFRRDGKYSNGRHPESVAFSKNILEDLSRRDFTINSIAWDLINKKLYDPFNGIKDLENRIIRAIGVPEERFGEDGLRAIRACRFASQLGFTIEDKTLEGIKKTLHIIPSVSAERKWEEIKKILLSPAPATAFRLFLETGILEIIIPELVKTSETAVSEDCGENLFEHLLKTCSMSPENNLSVRAAALFHDCALPSENHEEKSAEISGIILKRFKVSNAVLHSVTHLIKHHSINYNPEWNDADIRKFIYKVKQENLENLFLLAEADINSCSGGKKPEEMLGELKKRTDKIVGRKDPLDIKDLAVNGKDIISAGITPGPDVGKTLDYLFNIVLENPEYNKKEFLIKIISNNGKKIPG